ncbi:uncharacterized protein PHACADRAFT_263184 [Phanerochaete carnosa HHB-10118-sp]|uniref:C2H2-type domain-containing protein n=1 Tax=Phanerochaete carnosa (strain HHB-10118-sp) TaxID=650164 RepID=K5VIR3_PHACS|nr:uncharacterized protein PHACADRAFT_263184 [Phanerochaete carnosa HHB-10118-sp]EKM51178.1 hypothetical protein PHACADRAFT_263184 [Phanerochaete carnosa HHB-10118-sp]
MAAASAQPIALPSTSSNNQHDITMNPGSFGAQSGSFNASSYARRFISSPISFRAGSFGSRFYPGVSPGQLMGPLDPNDFRFGKLASSIESDRGASIMNALNDLQRQEELCRDYQCCGVNLNDMHALVDHFEECHVVVVDPYAPQQSYQNVPAGVSTNGQPAVPYFSDVPSAHVAPSYNQGSFDPDDMELDMESTSAPSSGSSSPPDTPISTPLSSYPSIHPQQALPMSSSPGGSRPISAFDTTTVMPSRTGVASLSVGFPPTRSSGPSVASRTEDAFNAYAGYSDYSSLMPGTNPSAVHSVDDQQNFSGAYASRPGCVPPALLLNSSATTPASTPDHSRVASPVSGQNLTYPIQPAIVPAASSSTQASASASSSHNAPQTPRASTTLSRPATSLLLSKPFKCPKLNCNKSYKQANGLKYHMTHGSCNFAPPKDLEQLQQLLASKRSQKSDEGEPLSDAELREVEREAERRVRPYACGVGDCQRRYKNMNGLRYHYQHSGDHGAMGLALLASGQHECLQHTRSHSRHVTPASSNQTSQRSSPLATSGATQAQSASTYSQNANAPPSYQTSTMHPPTYTLQPQQVMPQSQGQQSQQQQTAPMQMQYMMQMQTQQRRSS